MSNTNILGELCKLYYQISDVDLTGTDATILADSYVELCVKNLEYGQDPAKHYFNDRCNPTEQAAVVGRKSKTLSFELNAKRLSDTVIEAWNAAIDDASVISFLALTDEKDVATARGLVGNFVCVSSSETEPDEGAVTHSYTFEPADESTSTPKVRRIYGSSFSS